MSFLDFHPLITQIIDYRRIIIIKNNLRHQRHLRMKCVFRHTYFFYIPYYIKNKNVEKTCYLQSTYHDEMLLEI